MDKKLACYKVRIEMTRENNFIVFPDIFGLSSGIKDPSHNTRNKIRTNERSNVAILIHLPSNG